MTEPYFGWSNRLTWEVWTIITNDEGNYLTAMDYVAADARNKFILWLARIAVNVPAFHEGTDNRVNYGEIWDALKKGRE